MKNIFYSFLFFLFYFNIQAQPFLQYSNTYSYPGTGAEKGLSIDYDDAGNAYVTGTTDANGNNDIITIKYSPTGTKLWENIYSGNGNGDDHPVKVITDKINNNNRVYVTGYSKGNGTGYDWITIAYNLTTGDTVWTRRYNDPSNGDDKATDIEMDNAGNIYVSGSAYNNTTGKMDALLTKYNVNGNKIRDLTKTNSNYNLIVYDFAINTSSQVIFSYCNTSYSYIVSLDSAFNQIGGDYFTTTPIVKKIIPYSNYYYALITLPYNSTNGIRKIQIGNTLSDWYCKRLGTNNDLIIDFDIDASENVYAIYYDTIFNVSTTSYRYAKISSIGSQGDTLFTRKFDPTDQIDRPFKIKLGKQSTPIVYITGNTVKDGKSQNYTIGYNSATGTALWTLNQSCPSSGDKSIVDMQLDNYNNIYLTGSSNCGSTYDALTIKYCGSLPIANAGADKSVCQGSSVQIGSTPITNYIYSWSPATGLSNATIANPSASPGVNTTYILTATSPSGCYAYDTVVVTAIPAPIANAGNDQSMCNGASVQIGTSAVGGNTYSWSPSTGLSSSTLANPFSTVTNTTTYMLTVSNGTCSATDQILVTVKPLPNTALSVSPSNTICSGNSITLIASGATTYVWSPSGSGTTQTITPSNTITYTITGTTNGCDKSASQTLTVKPTPEIPVISQQHDTLYSNVVISGATYKWYKGATLLSTTSNPYFKITSTGSYTVQVTNNGCSATSSSFTVSMVTAVKNKNSFVESFILFPNPVTNVLNIKIQSNQNVDAVLKVIDINGKEILQQNLKTIKGETQQSIDVSAFAKGMYLIQLISDKGMVVDKFLVE